MKRLGLCLLTALIFARGLSAKNRIVFDDCNYYFGRISNPDTLLLYDFLFCNEGSDTLRMVRIESGCNVQVVSQETQNIPPETAGHIEIGLHPVTQGGKPGKFRERIYVYLPDTLIQLKLSGLLSSTH